MPDIKKRLKETAADISVPPEVSREIMDAVSRIRALENALTSMCYHWDRNLNNLDDGPEYEARETARQLLLGATQ